MNVGGQAVIEGVMMRTPHAFTVAVRRPDGGVSVRDEDWRSVWERYRFLRWPFFRGTVIMVESLVNGMQALGFSAQEAYPEEEAQAGGAAAGGAKSSGTEAEAGSAKGTEKLTNGAIAGTLAMSFAMVIVFFVALPHLLTAGLGKLLGTTLLSPDGALFHLIDGLIKLALFIGYIVGISFMDDIRRVFQYHGAEHKSIYAWEAGEPLTVENAKKYTTLHPRCGTSFLMFVLLVSFLLFSMIFPFLTPALGDLHPVLKNVLMIGIKIPLMLPIAGISYEAIRFSGKYPSNPILGLLSKPGLWMQRITTREPTDDQLEVALIALRQALAREQVWVSEKQPAPAASLVTAPAH